MKKKIGIMVDDLLIAITVTLIVAIMCLDDFDLEKMPIIILAIGIIVLNIFILKKRGYKLYE